ncbi:hypothetical protein [Aquimarina sp. 2201CG5-10]|uniref:hypothetical protein n=1 Tax=Aquimarina callyspongiae TaxID=3098150 RepID=UPI002AB589D9|nr:hypothetical protein [Aquimarina sp. 2201CG5-10]MDY8138084.1 hypothetical protein [Aquimarina sp. 2201CG5-10]
MKTLLNDLHLYELVLLFLGIFLFMILSAGLVYYIIKKEAIKRLLLFFPIPIIMIAYPSIQEITISSEKIELSKYQEKYIENPNDTIARQKLEELAGRLEERAQSPEDIVEISKTKLLLGDTQEAIKYANKAIEAEKEKIKDELSETSVSRDTINRGVEKQNAITQATQLKQLAKIQNLVLSEKDTAVLKAKIKSIKVSDELKGTKRIISSDALKRARKTN